MYTRKMMRLFVPISILLMVFSCMQLSDNNERVYKVLVLHSYFKNSEYFKQSVELYEKYFAEEGLHVELIHQNGDMPHMSRANMVRDVLGADIVDTEYDEPDLTIVNDDDMFHAIFEDSAWLCKRPVIFGGVNYMGDIDLSRFNNITGFTDTPDIRENLRLIKDLTGTKLIFAELGSHPEDSFRMTEIEKAIQELGWQNFTPAQLALKDNAAWLSSADSIKVVAVAADIQQSEASDDDHLMTRIHEAAMLDAKYAKHLQLRWTSTSNTYIDRSDVPQFTCINKLFGDSKVRFLAGYFTPLDTQIKDEVHYAAQVLRGTSIALLPVKEHEKGYFMDYKAMRQLKMDTKSYKDKFEIINLPFKERNPKIFWALLVAGILSALVLVAYLTWFLLSKYNQKSERMIRELQENNEKRDLALGESRTTLWQIKDGALHLLGSEESFSIEILRKRVDDDSKPAFDKLLGMAEADGKHVVRIKLRNVENEDCWYEIIYNLTERNRREKHLEGVAMNITDVKQNEDTILRANESQEIVNIKETIMANMSHDIRTPLGAVVGFADIMAAEGELLTPDERKTYASYIKQNSKMLATMISDILDERSEIGVFKFHKEDVNISELIHTVWNNNRVLCPKNLKLRELQDSDTTLCIHVDPHRIQEVLNNFLSNAFKFTHSGQVIVGWQLLEDEVELYVQDNGIGISPDKLETVFERYYKTSEIHKGTGMGLNICKTIIEQHNGRVEAKSKLGEGSRFSAFLKIFSLSTILLMMTASCQKEVNVAPSGKTYRVDLVHTYDSLTESYTRFDNTLKEEFRKAGMNVDLSIHFMDIYTGEPNSPQAQKVLKEIKENNPDLLLIEDDLGAYSLTGTNDPFLNTVPTVLGNIHLPLEGDSLSARAFLKGKNATAWLATTDHAKNLRMAYDIKKNNLIEIELDYTFGDMILRKRLSQSIATDEFLDDTDFHDMNLGWNDITVRLKDKIIVTAFSLRNPELNEGPADSTVAGIGPQRTKNIMNYAAFYTSLVVKKDLYSNSIALATDQPQFTCVNVDFGNSNANYIGGYFPLVETVATDMASYAIRILNGEKASSLPINYHKQDYYVDWNAILETKPENPEEVYAELSSKYNVVNVPFQTSNPKLYILFYVNAAILAILLVIACMWLWNKRRSKILRELKQRLDLDRQYGNLVLLGVSSCTFHYDRKNGLQLGSNEFNQLAIPEGLDAFNKIALQVKPEYLNTIEEIRRTITRIGDYNYLLPITLNKGFSYNWIQLRYKVTEKDGNLYANGLIIDANENVVREAQLNEAKIKQKETEQKDKFLSDLKNVISEPMNKILKYSEILAEESMAHTQEEYMAVVKKLDAEGQTLMDIVNKILELVRMESGRVQLELMPQSVNEVLTSMEQRWIQKLPELVQLDIQVPKAALLVRADRLRLDQLLDIFMERILSNTNEGKIRVDVNVDQVQNELEIVFKNSSENISHELNKLIQERFQEQRNFDPKIGLGLNIANAIATNMNGRLTFQSYPNVGTRIGIILKLCP